MRDGSEATRAGLPPVGGTVTEAPRDPLTVRRETEVAVLEAAVVAAVTAHLTARLTRVTGLLRHGFRLATTDPGRWRIIRQKAAGDLRGLRPDVASRVGRFLPRAARLGAGHAGGSLPLGHLPTSDNLISDMLLRVDQDVARKIELAATAILAGPLDTTAKLDATLARVDAVHGEAAQVAGDSVARAVAGGTVAVADAEGLGLTVVTERDACLSCRSMAGARRGRDGLFRPVRRFAARMIPWLLDGVTGPPFHGSCRCGLQVETPGLVDGLRREAERSVARGESLYDSLPARLRAVDRVLTSTRLPRSVRDRAAQDQARGRFSGRRSAVAPNRSTRAAMKRTG